MLDHRIVAVAKLHLRDHMARAHDEVRTHGGIDFAVDLTRGLALLDQHFECCEDLVLKADVMGPGRLRDDRRPVHPYLYVVGMGVDSGRECKQY